MAFATSQSFRYEKSDSVEVKLEYKETVQLIHLSTLFHRLHVPRSVHSDKRDSFLHECCLLAAILLV